MATETMSSMNEHTKEERIMNASKSTRVLLGALALASFAGAASGQVVINEVYQNPPGSGATNDAVLEFIELYGKPGMDLTGYAIGIFKGGADTNDDNIPNNASEVEIDEAFTLDGLSIGSNGFLVLYNGTVSQSLIPLVLPNEGETSASFFDAFIENPNDTLGNLSNDDSSTYVLMRRRPGHSIVDGQSVYGPEYAMWKDSAHDVDFDGKMDFGIELPVPGAADALMIDPMQIIDDMAWSDNGGKEYVRSSEQEISETDGFNPDAVSRLAYYASNPMLGSRLNSDAEVVPTRIADESWIYGECEGASIDMIYNPLSYGAPTDPSGDGFADISIANGSNVFSLTPGSFNDHAESGIAQFRFITGDLNFDGLVDAADLTLFDTWLLSADFDATVDYIHPDTGFPIADPANLGENFQSYVFQGPLANAYLSAACLSDADGTQVPGSQDREVLVSMVGVICPPDLNGDGSLNFLDVSYFLGNQIDYNNDNGFNFLDVSSFLQDFGAGCP
tara:strand:- start:120112 stop:121626 length:1515 start_codon:yes stop_codon:yes gene_type:complete